MGCFLLAYACVLSLFTEGVHLKVKGKFLYVLSVVIIFNLLILLYIHCFYLLNFEYKNNKGRELASLGSSLFKTASARLWRIVATDCLTTYRIIFFHENLRENF